MSRLTAFASLSLPLLLLAGPAHAAGPKVLGSQPVQDGQLMGNTIMFVGYDLAEGGTTPTVQVADDSDKSIVPIRVSARCQKAKKAGVPKRCNVLVRMLRWTVGHHYRAVLHGYTLRFTIIPGDPGVGRRPGSVKAVAPKRAPRSKGKVRAGKSAK